VDRYGIAFISLRDNLDLSTPSGRLMFQIIGAMAEFEGALERVKAGLWNARAKDKRIGRPQVKIELSKVFELRNQGLSWRAISDQLGLGLGMCRLLDTATACLRIEVEDVLCDSPEKILGIL
jgi:DNA invertase Pin-like site-specific DNA recombinase